MRLGVHVQLSGKIYKTVEEAQGLGCNTMQMFLRNPRRWREDFLAPEEVEEFIRRQKIYQLKPLFIHIPYLINLASPQPRLYHASIEAYIEDILEAQALEADYIVTHMGSHKGEGEVAGLKRLTAALNIILERTKNAEVGILLENTSGSGSWLGYKFSHQGQIIGGVKHKERIGLCLDTAHAYLAGYDLASKSGLEAMLGEIDKLLGLRTIKLIHLNDAKGKLNSRHDRHEHLGKGSIGLAGIKRMINHPQLKNIPLILETPKDSEDADRINLGLVRKLRS